jgi:hypothetical protein
VEQADAEPRLWLQAVRRGWLWAVFAVALGVAVVVSRNPDAFSTAGFALNQAIGRGEGVAPISRAACPPTHALKGALNQEGQRIYHIPTGALYEQTSPDVCFATREGAQAAGFRASRR